MERFWDGIDQSPVTAALPYHHQGELLIVKFQEEVSVGYKKRVRLGEQLRFVTHSCVFIIFSFPGSYPCRHFPFLFNFRCSSQYIDPFLCLMLQFAVILLTISITTYLYFFMTVKFLKLILCYSKQAVLVGMIFIN